MPVFHAIPRTVEAVQLKADIFAPPEPHQSHPGAKGALIAPAGDYLVVHDDGRQEFVKKALFEATYQPPGPRGRSVEEIEAELACEEYLAQLPPHEAAQIRSKADYRRSLAIEIAHIEADPEARHRILVDRRRRAGA